MFIVISDGAQIVALYVFYTQLYLTQKTADSVLACGLTIVFEMNRVTLLFLFSSKTKGILKFYWN